MTTQNEAPGGMTERELLLADHRPKSRGMRRFLWIVLMLVLALSLSILVTSVVLDYKGSSELNAVLAQVRTAGLPLNYTDPFYRKWDSERPTSSAENAAVSYEEAFSLLQPNMQSAAAKRVPYVGEVELPGDPGRPLSAAMVTAMRDFVWTNVQALELLHEGAKAPECYFPVDWQGPCTLLPHLSKVRNASRLIAVKIVLDAEEGRAPQAIESVQDGLALAGAVAKEPELISGIVSCAISDFTVSAALRLAAREDLSNEELIVLQNAFSAAAHGLSLRTAYAGEIAGQSYIYEKILEGDLSVLPLEGIAGAPSAVQDSWRRTVAWLARGYIKSDRAHCLKVMLRIVQAAGNTTPADIRRGSWSRSASRDTLSISRMLLPALDGGLRMCEVQRARLRSAAACCAAMRYRNDKGKWPVGIEALAPDYLDSVPLDPFTGMPLVYRVDQERILIYSTGPNLRDDLGGPQLTVRPGNISKQAWRGCDDAGFAAGD